MCNKEIEIDSDLDVAIIYDDASNVLKGVIPLNRCALLKGHVVTLDSLIANLIVKFNSIDYVTTLYSCSGCHTNVISNERVLNSIFHIKFKYNDSTFNLLRDMMSYLSNLKCKDTLTMKFIRNLKLEMGTDALKGSIRPYLKITSNNKGLPRITTDSACKLMIASVDIVHISNDRKNLD